MRFSVGSVYALSLAYISLGSFFLFCMIAWGQTGGNEIMDAALISPLFVGIAGITFLRVKRESLQSTNTAVWVAIAMYAILGVYLLWILHQIMGFDTS